MHHSTCLGTRSRTGMMPFLLHQLYLIENWYSINISSADAAALKN